MWQTHLTLYHAVQTNITTGANTPLNSSCGNDLNCIVSLIILADCMPQMELQSPGVVFMLACHAETNSGSIAGKVPMTVMVLEDRQTEHRRSRFTALSIYIPPHQFYIYFW